MSKNFLVLCTGNSARSIMAEAYINHASNGNWKAFSAGSKPAGSVNPFALQTLGAHGIKIENARSKSWDEFARPDAARMDIVITVCDNAASEPCPHWPGTPQTWHWPFYDPAAATGSDKEKLAVFEKVFDEISETVDQFLEGIPGADIARIRTRADNG